MNQNYKVNAGFTLRKFLQKNHYFGGWQGVNSQILVLIPKANNVSLN